MLAHPLRARLQRGVNRLMYGERDNPVTVLNRLGLRLEAALAPNTVLPSLVETVAQALKLPYAAIELTTDDERRTAVSYPSREAVVDHPLSQSLVSFPLAYQGETIGYLLVAPRAAGEAFSPLERHLLENIARQAGMAVHAVGLTHELQLARQRLVAALEEERRRLRRDLHDGLGPQLASQTMTLAAARQLLRTDPGAADALLAEATKHAQAAIADIRRLVYDLRPPALDDLGLVAALRAQAAEYETSGVHFTVTAPEPWPPLPVLSKWPAIASRRKR